jgi:hypothetical protein
MKKNDIFSFKAPNGVEVTAVALYAVTLFIGSKFIGNKWICYAQNRLFTMMDYKGGIKDYEEPEYDETIVDYAVLPKYDKMLERYNDIEVSRTETANGM